MAEPWELSPPDTRVSDQVASFIIFCEDENDEPYYFRSFQIAGKLKVNCIPNQKKAKLNLLNAITHCCELGLVDYNDHTYKMKEPAVENVWCVYDRDLENTDLAHVKPVDDANFTTAITTALQAGIKVAWSNDAFELWVLLHFEKVLFAEKLHRNYVYGRLTTILMAFPNIQQQYAGPIAAGTFSYKSYLKRRQDFLTYVLPLLKDRTAMALINAAELEKEWAKTVPYHDCNPCTKVHHLVTALQQAQA